MPNSCTLINLLPPCHLHTRQLVFTESLLPPPPQPGDIWKCLETFLVFTSGVGVVCYWSILFQDQ